MVQPVEFLGLAEGLAGSPPNESVIVITIRPDPPCWRPHNIAIAKAQAERLWQDLGTVLSRSVVLLLCGLLAVTIGCSAKVKVESENWDTASQASTGERSRTAVQVDVLQPRPAAPGPNPPEPRPANTVIIHVNGGQVHVDQPPSPAEPARPKKSTLNSRIGWPTTEHGPSAFLGYLAVWTLTPKVEVDLCGHATLVSAHVLWTEGRVSPPSTINFYTKSGLLKAARKNRLIELDLLLEPPFSASPTPGLLEALGVSAKFVGKNRFDFLVEVESEDVVCKMAPDFARLALIEVRGVIVTAQSANPQYDFVSRFFTPWAGVNEDPVTGSAHCCLGPFWRDRLGKDEVVAYQASARGGVVHVRVADDRTYLGGQAVTVFRGELLA